MNFDGLIFYLLIGTTLFVLLVTFLITFTIMYRRRQIQYDQERIEMERMFSEELLRTQLELSEQVMKNISQEIHDNIGQTLIVAKLGLNNLDSHENHSHIENIKNLISRSLRDLRSLSKTLNGDFILNQGLQNALVKEIDILNNTCEIIGKFNGNIPDNFLDANAEIIVFRCIQEALSNSLKHAQAKTIAVNAHVENDTLKLSVSDDGIGFNISEVKNKGLGMNSLEKRVAVLGGKLQIQSTLGSGSNIEFEFSKSKQ